jgi:hypothetical protein
LSLLRHVSKKALANQLLARTKRQYVASGGDGLDGKIAALRSRLFDKQLAYIDDTSDRKAMLCPRRAGKSTTISYDILLTGLQTPRAKMVLIGITRGKARQLCWDELKILNDEFGLCINFNNHFLEATFPNGSKLMLGGADSRHEIEKYRGGFYHKVWIDEAASYPPGLLQELCSQVIEPTLLDYRGTLTLAGTPGKVLEGHFYEITKPNSEKGKAFDGTPIIRKRGEKDYSWSVHRWNTFENKAMPHIWDEVLLQKESEGWSDDDPRWRREYLGEWIADNSNFSFRFQESRDTWRQDEDAPNFGLPKDHEWRFILGMDLGYDDPTAFVVLAYSETHPHCYEVHAHAEDKLAPHQVAANVKELEARFGGFEAIVGDRGGQAKMLFEGFSHDHGISIIAADKHQKRDHVELINSDLMSGRLKIRHDSPLVFGLHFIQWNKAGANFDKLSAPTHLADAFLYVWRFAYHHFFEERVKAPTKGTQEWLEKKLEEEERLVEAELVRRDSLDYWDRELADVINDSSEWN